MSATRRSAESEHARALAPRILDGLRVVVVGVNFAPEVTGIAPYTSDICSQLHGFGAEVTAITGVPHYPAWRVASAYRWTIFSRENHGGVCVRRARHYVPSRQTGLRRALFELSFLTSAWLASVRVDADVVLAITPNLGALPIAATIARRSHAAYGIIVQDLLGKAAIQSGVAVPRGVATFTARLEGRWIRHADAVGIISDAFAGPLIDAGVAPGRILQLPNYAHVNASPHGPAAARRLLEWPEEGTYVIHTGNMGVKQQLENVVAAARIAEIQSPRLRFVLLGDGSQRRTLEGLCADRHNIRFVEPLDEARYPLALAAADVLLVNERPTVTSMSLPSKLTSYFAAGRPVVAATTETGATARLIRAAGAGIIVPPNDPTALVTALEMLAGNGDLRRSLAGAGQEYARANLSRASAGRRVLQLVANLAKRDVCE